VYTPEYNIGFLGLEKLHPFDAGKWGKIYEFLKGTLCQTMSYGGGHLGFSIHLVFMYRLCSI
jgi:hypothetical protein